MLIKQWWERVSHCKEAVETVSPEHTDSDSCTKTVLALSMLT